MAFGLNRVELIGRLGADAEIVSLSNGTKIAKLRVATDESYISKQSGQRVDAQEWHQVVTFQPGLVSMFEKHGRKGRLVFIQGKLQTRRWRKDGEDTDRYSTEIMVIPGQPGVLPRQARRDRRRAGRPRAGSAVRRPPHARRGLPAGGLIAVPFSLPQGPSLTSGGPFFTPFCGLATADEAQKSPYPGEPTLSRDTAMHLHATLTRATPRPNIPS